MSYENLDIVLFGIQGSGKGTLGKVIAEKYGYQIFETGSELRKLSHQDSPLAQKVKKIIESGKLVPNEVVMDIIENFMQQLAPGTKVVFDGIPRSMEQAETFEKLMQRHGRDFIGILVDVPKEEAINRLSSRRVCKECKTVYPAFYTGERCEKCGGELIMRSDDNPESIKTRIEAFFTETMPVIDRYKKMEKMIVMNGDQSMAEAAREMCDIVEKKIQLQK
jgi:adenylate kinase